MSRASLLHLSTTLSSSGVRLDPSDADPLTFHRRMPEYERTPLIEVPSIAARLGVRAVHVKDESRRLGLPSFKMLGASWATARAIARTWHPELGSDLDLQPIRDAVLSGPRRRLAAATDGNHGRGVARMAALLGLDCMIFVPAGTARSRIDDIASEGAEVQVVEGSYDDAIVRSAQEADDNTLIISDTSWEGYTETPIDVIQGYSTLFREIDAALSDVHTPPPTHLVLQSGVGSFAAAGLSHARRTRRAEELHIAIVEPTAANCLQRSAIAGQLDEAPGPHDSTMAGLNCGLPSVVAWPIVYALADSFISIDDGWAFEAMALLAEVGIVAGESGAAALGGLLAMVDTGHAEQIGLNSESIVIVINTEGATDPNNFSDVTSLDPIEVATSAGERRRTHGATLR